MLTKDQITWCAGLVEGEGCFRWKTSSPTIVVQMSDKDVVEKLARLWKVNCISLFTPSLRKRGGKPMFSATLLGRDAAGWMMTLYFHMGLRRQGKIKEVLSIWKSRQAHPRQVTPRNKRLMAA